MLIPKPDRGKFTPAAPRLPFPNYNKDSPTLTKTTAALYKQAGYYRCLQGTSSPALLCSQEGFPRGDLFLPAASGVTPLAQWQISGGKMRIDVSFYPLETTGRYLLISWKAPLLNQTEDNFPCTLTNQIPAFIRGTHTRSLQPTKAKPGHGAWSRGREECFLPSWHRPVHKARK